MSDPYLTWAEIIAGGDQGTDELPDLMGLVPWDKCSPQQAAQQIQMLTMLRQRYQSEMQSWGPLTEEHIRYLDNTPYEDLSPEWKTVALAVGTSSAMLQTVEAQLRQGQQQWPEYAAGTQGAGTEAPAPEGVPTVPTEGGGTPPAPMTPWGQTPEQMMTPEQYIWSSMSDEQRQQYRDLALQAYETQQKMNDLTLQTQQHAWQQATGPMAKAYEGLGMMDYLSDRKWTQGERERYLEDYERLKQWSVEDRQRQIEAEQRSIAQAAWARAFQQRQLGAQVGHNIGGMEQDAWRFMAQNALPQGIGHVPGFGPDSRLAGIMGPSFQGLPTVTLQTPDPRAPYSFGQRYASGGVR